MTTRLDLEPAANRMARLVRAVPDELQGRPTPCDRYAVGDLLDHIGGAALASPRPATLPAWDKTGRSRIPGDVAALAQAWRDPGAWTGMTTAGGVDLPPRWRRSWPCTRW